MKLGTFVVVRTYSAGVHVGTLSAQDGKNVTLTDARRVWRWHGANTLHELANVGCDKVYSRISDPVSSIDLTEAIELLACTDTARADLCHSRWGR